MNVLEKNKNKEIYPRENECFEDYRNRITLNKNEYNLTWQDIKDLAMYFYDQKISDNWRKYVYLTRDKETFDYDNTTRILCVSDFHVPFQVPVSTFEKYKNKVDILVINGDLLDTYSMSKFTKMYRQPLITELKSGREYVIELVRYIKPKKVVANVGNHEMRLGKAIADKIGTDLSELMPTDTMAFLFDTGFNEYDHLTARKIVYPPLKETLGEEGYEVEYTNSFWTKIGNTIFVHPLAFRSNPLGTTVKAYDYFTSKGEKFDTIVMAHTHQAGFSKYGYAYLYEEGCCTDIDKMKYADTRLPKTPQQNGYVYLVQDENGDIVYEKTKLELF